MASMTQAVRRIKSDPRGLIDPDAVDRACAAAHLRWRERTLPPQRTLDLFATQVMHGNTSIAHVVRLSDREFGESAYCQARRRVPVSVVRAALEAGTARWLAAARERPGTWRGHRTFLADGTGCDMPETPELQTHFGQPPHPGPGCGFPVAHVLTLFDAPSGLLLGMVVSPFATQDIKRMPRLHSHLQAGDVLITDRGICAYVHIATLAARGVHVVCRAHQGRPMPYPAPTGPRARLGYNRHRRKTPLLVERLGELDQVVELLKPRNRPAWMNSEEFARIPSRLVVRVLKFRVDQPGFRTREIELMTTLLDAARYPAEDLAALYLSRWRIEVNLRHLKQTLGMTSLRCRSVEGVTKELLMFALVYNAVRAVMIRAGERQNEETDRISFVDALRWLIQRRDDDVPTLKVNPARTGRLCARLVKRGPRFPRLTVPRAIWRKRWLEKHLI